MRSPVSPIVSRSKLENAFASVKTSIVAELSPKKDPNQPDSDDPDADDSLPLHPLSGKIDTRVSRIVDMGFSMTEAKAACLKKPKLKEHDLVEWMLEKKQLAITQMNGDLSS